MRRRLGRVLNIPHIELAVNFREVVPARQNQFRWWFCGQRRKIEHRFTLVADVKAECDPEPTHLNTSDLRLSHQRGTFTTEPIGLSVSIGLRLQRAASAVLQHSLISWVYPSAPAKTGLQYIELAVVFEQSQAVPPLPLFVLSFKKGHLQSNQHRKLLAPHSRKCVGGRK